MKTKNLFLVFALCGGCAALALGSFLKWNNSLHQAIERGQVEDLRKAIMDGGNVNGRGMHALTPLMKAAGSGRVDMCELLLKHGADVNAHTESGNVLMWAINSGSAELVQFLLKSGANKSWSNALGQTAETLALQRGFTNIASIVNVSNAPGRTQ